MANPVPITAPPKAEDSLTRLNLTATRELVSYNKLVLADYRRFQRTVRNDAIDTVDAYIAALARKYDRWFGKNSDTATRAIALVDKAAKIGHAIRFNANIAKKLNAKGQSILVKDFSIGHEEGIPKLISSQWQTQQIDLIKRGGSVGHFDTPPIPDLHFDRLTKIVQDAVHNGTRWEDLQASLAELDGVSQRRAEVIARDQVGKYNGVMTQQRSKSLGITHYFWRTVGDESVRPEHVARNGRRFAYDSPPSDGPPGQPVQCRCYADPDLDAAIAARRRN